MDSAPVPSVNLEQFYRFALLLCGSAKAAEAVLAAALAEMQNHVGHLRSASSRQAWLIARISKQSHRTEPRSELSVVRGLIRAPEEEIADPMPLLAIEAYLFAQRFSTLAEPGKTALALFYLDLLPVGEIPNVLQLSWDRFCDVLTAARAELKQRVHEMRVHETVSL